MQNFNNGAVNPLGLQKSTNCQNNGDDYEKSDNCASGCSGNTKNEQKTTKSVDNKKPACYNKRMWPECQSDKISKRKKRTNEKICNSVRDVLRESPRTISVTVADLAKASGVSKSTIYRNYGSVDNILPEAEKIIIEDFQREFHFFGGNNRPLADNFDVIALTIERNREHFSVTIPRGDFYAIKIMLATVEERICADYFVEENKVVCWHYLSAEFYFILQEWSKTNFPSETRRNVVEAMLHTCSSTKANTKTIIAIKNRNYNKT